MIKIRALSIDVFKPMHSQFQRLFRLIKKTGDNIVLFDPESKDPYILMNLDAYEELLESYSNPPMGEKILHSNTDSTKFAAKPQIKKVPQIDADESEVLPGIDTEVVDLGAEEKESEPEQGEKYYFEEVEDTETEGEKEEKTKGDN